MKYKYNVIKNHKEVVRTFHSSSEAAECCGFMNAFYKNDVFDVSQVIDED